MFKPAYSAGTIPQQLGNLQNLEGLSLTFNKLAGSIPVQLFNISTLQILLLPGNNLSGNLPSTVGSGLINLEKLYLDGNDFEGVIPASISNASNLVCLSLAANRFSGPIPNSLGDLRLLRELSLFQNNFTNDPSSPELSFISYLTNCKNLTILIFGDKLTIRCTAFFRHLLETFLLHLKNFTDIIVLSRETFLKLLVICAIYGF